MEISPNTVSTFFAIALMALGWLFGRSWHDKIPESNAIQLPDWFRFFLGPPGANGAYNVRGIYFQIFVLLFTVPFILVDLGILSRHSAFQVFLGGMFIFPVLEILRWATRR